MTGVCEVLVSDAWPQSIWNVKHGALRTKSSAVLSSFLLSSLKRKANAFWKHSFNVFPGESGKMKWRLVCCPKSQRAISNSWDRHPSSSLWSFASFLHRNALQHARLFGLHHVCREGKWECFTQFSINLPGLEPVKALSALLICSIKCEPADPLTFPFSFLGVLLQRLLWLSVAYCISNKSVSLPSKAWNTHHTKCISKP